MLIFGNWGGVPAVPEQPDGGLVPPVKVLRKRLNGVYRADGFSGPTRRYVLVVALLVGLASLPTLAAITAGTNELDHGTTGAMDVPFLPPPSSGPVVPVQPSPAPSSGVLHGQAGKRRAMPHRYDRSDVPRSEAVATTGRRSRSTQASSAGASRRRPERAGSGRPQTDGHTAPAPHGGPVPPGHAVPPKKPATPSQPADPDDRPPPLFQPPLCHDRGECGVRESWHHRPDWSRHRRCEDGTHRTHPRWSTRQDGSSAIMQDDSSEDRSPDQSEQTGSSAVTERPSNVRPQRWGDRTDNSRRHRSESRWDDGQPLVAPYRGAHRAADDSAYDRSSRVGRHHREYQYDYSDRW